MAANWGDTTFEYCINASYGTYLSKYLRSIDHPFIFLDIGANQGIFSLIAAQNINCVQVLAFEPVRASFDMLERNIRANPGNEKVAAFNFGISNAEAVVPIVIPEGHSGAASLHATDKANGRREHVTIKRASVIAEHIRSDLPICVKIDTEGHEKPVADGLAASPFADRIEAAFYEVDESWLDPKEIEFIFRRLNLSDFEIVGRKPHSKPHYDVMARRPSTLAFLN